MNYAPPATLPALLRATAGCYPERVALVFKERRWTYREFEQEVYKAARGFLRLGMKKGDRIALLLPNCPEFLFAVFAASEIGAVFVPMNPASTLDEAEYVLAHSGASLVVGTVEWIARIGAFGARLPELTRMLAVDGAENSRAWAWEALLAGAPNEALQTTAAPADLASITYTSGTTDRPKGVMLSQYAYAFAPRTRAIGLGWNENDRVLCLLPLFHVNALCHMCLGMFSRGGTIVLTERFSASRFWDEVRAFGITTSSLMRTIPQILLSLPERPDDRNHPLRLVVALLSPEMHVRFEERFNVLAVPSYSLTEDILSVIGPLDRAKRKLGSCGLPLAPEVHRLKILDAAGRELAPGETGEIVKRSPTVMQGYYKNPEATAKALRDGWLYTGDLGYLDEDGFLFFVDRLKDIVRRGDENISSEEVERVLNSHPQIAESAVVAVPDEIRGEEAKAYVVPKAPAAAPKPEEIWRFCEARLAAFKVPRYLEYCDALPKTPSSKIQKNILRERGKMPGSKVFDRQAKGTRSA
ncbi:MAG TPA: AMP-binding protein [Candidatus Eisenbacteria bacterium]|nr:AMP-binding protein [Candidatus Eisenbacteria bacterium]